VIHILEGRARLTLGGEERQAGPGTWVHMPAWLKHSVHAETRVVMLLLLLKTGEA
jgi:quercetin dioxygenase-like cupin family protein